MGQTGGLIHGRDAYCGLHDKHIYYNDHPWRNWHAVL